MIPGQDDVPTIHTIGAQVPHTVGYSCTIHLVSNGAMGVQLKSYRPLSVASVAIRGFKWDGRSRLMVRYLIDQLVSELEGK